MPNKNDTKQTLDSFCQNRSSFKTKLALLSFYKVHYPKWINQLLVVFEYLQLMSQVLLLPGASYDNPEYYKFPFQIVVYFFKLVNPSYLLTYESRDTTTLTVLIMVLCLVLLKLLLFAYVVCMSLWGWKKKNWLVYLWKWVFKLQSRVIYLLLTTFWIRALIFSLEDNLGAIQMNKGGVVCVTVFVVLIELALSLIIETQFCYVLPCKNYLSSKNSDLPNITLLQKFIMQILLVIMRADSQANAWIISVFALVISLIRSYLFYRDLPLYHLKALLLQGDLVSAMLVLNIVYCVNNILRSADSEGRAGINFIISSWIGISILAIRISRGFLFNKVTKLVSCKTAIASPERLVHKIVAAKRLKDYEEHPGKKTNKYEFTYLLSLNQTIKFADIFDLNESEIKNSREEVSKNLLLYCEDLLNKFPESILLKLHLAKLYSKNSESYTKIINLASEIESQKWSMYYLSSSLLLYKIEKSILESQNSSSKERNLDFLAFIKNKVMVENLKKEMMKQADLYVQVYDNIIGDVSDFGEIYNSADPIQRSKKNIYKMTDRLFRTIPDTFISPFLICAEYSLVLNYSLIKFDKYIALYAQKYFKNERYFKEQELIEENFYQDTNAFLLLSSQKNNCGEILFASKSLQTICGESSTGYIGKNISSLFPPTMRAYNNDFFRNGFKEEGGMMNRVQRGYLCHKSHYLIEADFCFKYHPYLNQNLCLDMIIRPIPRAHIFLLLKENGDVEGTSKEIAKLLGFDQATSSSVNIRHLSEDLARVNTAFNIVLKNRTTGTESALQTPDPKSILKRPFSSSGGGGDDLSTNFHQCFTFETSRTKMSFHHALELHSAYIKDDQRVKIYPIVNDQQEQRASRRSRKNPVKRKGFNFYCNVQVVPFGDSMHLKLVTLKEASSNQFEETEIDYLTSPNYKTEFTSSPHKGSPQKFTFRDDEIVSENAVAEERDNYETENIPTTYRRQVFDFQEEKLQTLMSTRNNRGIATTQADVPLISPTSETRRFFLDTQVSIRRQETLPAAGDVDPLASPRAGKKVNFLAVGGGQEAVLSYAKITDETQSVHFNNAKKKEKVEKYLSSHGSSQRSVEKASKKAFKAAIHEKSYPKSFNILCAIFYGVILFTFASQIVMKISSDWTMGDLQTKKDLLKFCQERSYKAMLAQINALGGYLTVQGALRIGGAIGGLDVAISNLKLRTADMQKANSEMLKNSFTLEDKIKEKLFMRDVRMFGTFLDSFQASSNYENMTSFQATEDLMNAAQAVGALQNPISKEGLNGLYYIANNVMNDFEYKNLEITQILIDSVSDQKESYENTTFLCVILTPFLLIGIAILLTVIILNQYRIEKRQMSALIKLRSGTMKDLCERIKKFKRNLINEDNFQDNWLPNMSEDLNIVSSLQNEKISTGYSKKHDTPQTIKYKKFRKRYYKYIFCVVLYISVLVAINIYDWVATKRATKVIYTHQDQLQYANYISNRVTVAYASFAVLFISNNTMYVEHKKTSTSHD